jgi:casein kinase 1
MMIIGRRFRLDERLGGGSFGDIYRGTDLETNREIAVKLENKRNPSMQLMNENNLYRVLQAAAAFLKFTGSESKASTTS